MTRRESDRRLVERMLAGEESAFDEFADRVIPALHRFARVRLRGDRELTRDIVQSTVCKAIAKLDTYRGEAALLTWLCACCRNEIAGHFRRRQKVGTEVAFQLVEEIETGAMNDRRPAGPERVFVRKETAERVHLALDSLPPHYGKALEWKYLEAASVREIAVRLDMSPKAAESLLTRARNAFKEEYDLLTRTLSAVGATPSATRLEANS